MRKFFKHIITVITESVLFGIAIAWYYSVENKYGPLALGVGALSAICTSIYCIFSKDKGKKEVIIEITKEVIEGITERIIAELSKTKPMDEQQRKETEANIQDIIKYYETVDINHASPLYKQAFELFTKGQIDEALALLDEDKMVATEKRSADARILKAQLFYLKNDFENAETNFLKAADIFPSCENNFQVANFYDKQNNFQAAETWYTRCLALAGTPKEKTSILTNLGNLHSDLNDHTKAEEAYKEALQIYRKLADVNPQAYRPDVATTLNKLGNLHQNMNDYLKAEKAYKEALQIRRELADINPQEYRPDVATTLNDLGVLHRNMKDYLKAEEDYKEALQIRRELADVNPQLDRPDVAGTLNNLGALHGEMNDYTKANADYREALQIYRELADVNPQAYRPDVAMTLNNLGILHSYMEDYPKAEEAFEEASNIYRKLADVNPQAYRLNVAMALNNLGNLHSNMNDYTKAEEAYEEALKIRRELAKDNPQAYLPEVIITLTNLSIFYLQDMPDKEKSIRYIEEVLSYRTSLKHLPNALHCIETAEEVLRHWNIRHWNKR